jgi:hypothetical protein
MMSLDWTRFFNLIGMLSIFVVLIVMALLSKRLGIVTRTRPYYLGFYVAALLMGISIIVRIMGSPTAIDPNLPLQQDGTVIFFYGILPALSLTLGVIVAWRYWSWLFAERN